MNSKLSIWFNKERTILIAFISVLLISHLNSNCQQFPLDSTFGINGKTIIDINSTFDAKNNIDYQSDHSIILATSVFNSSTQNYDFCILRFKPNGMLDTTFGNQGLVLFDLGHKDDLAYNVKVQPDDKILVVGATGSTNNWDFVIARFCADGSVDDNFGENGIVKRSKYFSDIFYAVALDKNLRLLVAGYSNDLSYLFRFMPDGETDYSFGDNGIATLNLGGADNETKVNAISISTAEEIYISGELSGNSIRGFVTKFDSTGQKVLSFGSNGSYITPSNKYCHIFTCYLQPDSKLLIAGNQLIMTPAVKSDFLVIRLLNSGIPDTSFNHSGWVNVNFDRTANVCNKVIVQNLNSIFALGYSDNIPASDANLSVVKLLENGYPDLTWGEQGKISYDFGSTNDIAYGAFIDHTDRLVVSGVYGNDNNALLCRFKTSIYDNIQPLAKAENKLNIYPNPCKEFLCIDLPFKTFKAEKLKFSDIMGKQYYPEIKCVNNQLISINTGNLPKGIFLISYQDKGKLLRAKIIKE